MKALLLGVALPLAWIASLPTQAPAEASASRVEWSPPEGMRGRFLGLVPEADGGFLDSVTAQDRGMVRFDGLWLGPREARKIPGWVRQASRIQDWDDAWKTATRHYRIESDLPRHRIELEIGPFLDELYRTYVRIFDERFGRKGKGANKKEVRIYRDFEEYARLEPESDGSPRPRGNPAFILDGELLVVFWDDADPDSFFSSVCHEAAHQFMSGLYPGAELPVWLDEGIACYFESCRWSRSRQTLEFGEEIPPERLECARSILADVEEADVSDAELARRLFLGVDRNAFDAGHYALATTFVHHLVAKYPGKKGSDLFGSFLKESNGSGVKPVEEVWEEATRIPFAEAAEGWRAHVFDAQVGTVGEWCFLAEPSASARELGFRKHDRVLSVAGVEVFDAEHFDCRWAGRDPEQPIEVVVVRASLDLDAPEGAEAIVSIAVPRGAICPLRVEEVATRSFFLID